MRRPSSSKNSLLEWAIASVRFMYLRRPTLSMVSRVIIFSSSAARAMVGLMVEQGIAPSEYAIFWFTTVRMRPLLGSTATTEPLYLPRASTAAARTIGSSFSAISPSVGSTAFSRGTYRWRDDFRVGRAAAADAGAGNTQQVERKNARDVFANPLVLVIRVVPGLFILRGGSRFL